MDQKSAVVMITGGTASATALTYALRANLNVQALCLYDRYDDPFNTSAARVASRLRVTLHQEHAEGYRADPTGLILLAHGAALAARLGATRLILGNWEKHRNTRDQAFFQDFFGKLFGLSTDGPELVVYAPCAALSRAEVVRWGAMTLGADYRFTDDCQTARALFAPHCGRCPGCLQRQEAFREAEVPDPARYALSAVR